jgi:hypothetical protein
MLITSSQIMEILATKRQLLEPEIIWIMAVLTGN